MKCSLWIAVAAILMGPCIVLAQEREPRPIGVYGPVAGDMEVTVTGSGNNDPDFDTGSFTIGGSIGYFLTDNVEVALRQRLSIEDFDDDDLSGATRVALDYHFDLDRLRPFVGVNVGGAYGDEDLDDSFGMGLEGGVKYFVQEGTFLFGIAEYQWLFDDSFDDGQFLYSIGVGFLF